MSICAHASGSGSLEPPFDLFGWVLDLAQAASGSSVLDVGCGNGAYLARLQARGATVTGCDLSLGMLPAGTESQLVNADAQSLPFPSCSSQVGR